MPHRSQDWSSAHKYPQKQALPAGLPSMPIVVWAKDFSWRASRKLEIKLISHAFDGSNAIKPQFLADLADMNVDRAVSDDHLITPDLVQYLVTQEDPARS